MHLFDADFLLEGWEAIQYDGANALEISKHLFRLPEWLVTYDGETEKLSIRRDYSPTTSTEWVLDSGDWAVVSPFNTLHIFDDIEFNQKFTEQKWKSISKPRNPAVDRIGGFR